MNRLVDVCVMNRCKDGPLGCLDEDLERMIGTINDGLVDRWLIGKSQVTGLFQFSTCVGRIYLWICGDEYVDRWVWLD